MQQKEPITIVIDNNVDNLGLIEQAVKYVRHKTKCICLLHGDEAITFLSLELKHPPAYIFIDANMVDLTISKCLLILRKNPTLNHSCVVVFSTVMPGAVADVYRQQGADFAFTKPFTTPQAKNLVEHIISTNPKRRNLAFV